jgi:hypothetical protein
MPVEGLKIAELGLFGRGFLQTALTKAALAQADSRANRCGVLPLADRQQPGARRQLGPNLLQPDRQGAGQISVHRSSQMKV